MNQFRRTRDDHKKETAEDYVELIEHLTTLHGEARAVDLAKDLGISQVSVSKTLQRLQKEGFLTVLPYRSIFLTDAGKDLAARSRKRHTLVVDFLRALGVPDQIAEVDAEGIEHHVSQETLSAMKEWTRQQKP